MLNFLLDITPDKSQLLITIKLAGILREKKQGRCVVIHDAPSFFSLTIKIDSFF